MKQIKTSGQGCHRYVSKLQPFTNHSGSLTGDYYPSKRQYVVWSYDHWPLYIFDKTANTWFGNSTKFSRTTSKHSTQSMPHIGGLYPDITWLDRVLMDDLFAYGYHNLVKERITA
jgi:hypothetical protein